MRIVTYRVFEVACTMGHAVMARQGLDNVFDSFKSRLLTFSSPGRLLFVDKILSYIVLLKCLIF